MVNLNKATQGVEKGVNTMDLKISEIRKLTGLSRIAFSKFYNIPLRTVEDWEWEKKEPPVYVKNFLERIVKEDVEAGIFNNPA